MIRITKVTKEEVEKAVLVAIVTIIAVIAAVVFLILPGMKEKGKIKNKVMSGMRETKEAHALIKNMPAMQENIAKFREEILYYKSRLPEKAGYSWFLEYINTLGNSLDIQFESMVPQEREGLKEMVIEGHSYKEVLLLIKLKGDYHQMGKLINNLENYSEFINIRDLTISLEKEQWVKQDVTLLVHLLVLKG